MKSIDKVQLWWPGLTAEHLAELELQVCRCRFRHDLFEGGNLPPPTSYRQRGVAEAVGRLCQFVVTFIAQRYPPKQRPQIQEMVKHLYLSDKSVTQPKLNKFLEGGADDDVWYAIGRRLFLFLIRGVGAGGGEAGPHVRQLDYFFFREEDNPQQGFFDDLRLRYPAPYSWSELAGEVGWYARDAEARRAAGQRARVVLVSGAMPFPFDGPARDLAKLLARLLDEGGNLDVAFVYGDGSPAAKSVRQLEQAVKAGPKGKPRVERVPLKAADPEREGADDPERPAFVNALGRFVYLRSAEKDREAVYAVRALPVIDDGSTPKKPNWFEPVCYEGTALDLTAIRDWLGRVAPSPGETNGRNGAA